MTKVLNLTSSRCCVSIQLMWLLLRLWYSLYSGKYKFNIRLYDLLIGEAKLLQAITFFLLFPNLFIICQFIMLWAYFIIIFSNFSVLN
jgi:hypothetical protein